MDQAYVSSETIKSYKDKLFLADARKGHAIKTVIETLSKFSKRISVKFTELGIFSRPEDKAQRVLFDLVLNREAFTKYKCEEDLIRSFNIAQIAKQISGLKKKDSLTLFIKKDTPSKLCLYVKPESKENESELFEFECQIETEYIIKTLPIKHTTNDGEKIRVYNKPVVMETTRFQKIKTIVTQVKTFTIYIQEGYFISAFSNMGNMSSSRISSGERTEDGKWYQAEFQPSIFKTLCKLNSISKTINISSPLVDQYPLRLDILVDSFGKLTIFVKDNKQIEYETAETAPFSYKKSKKKERK